MCSQEDAEVIYIALRAVEILIPESDHEEKGSVLPSWKWDDYGWILPAIMLEAATHTVFVQGDPEGWEDQRLQSEAISKEGFGPLICRSLSMDWAISPLPEPSSIPNADLFKVLSERRTKRDFSNSSPVDLSLISGVLHYAARAQRIWEHPYYGLQMLRTSPSGGARHPIEIYPQILKSTDVTTGNYLYCPLRHALLRIGDVDQNAIYSIGQQQNGCLNGSLAFLITTNYPRNFWKYRYSRSFLFSHYDCGHFVQTLLLVLEAYGLNSFLTPAVNIMKGIEYLSIDNFYDETPSYLIVAG